MIVPVIRFFTLFALLFAWMPTARAQWEILRDLAAQGFEISSNNSVTLNQDTKTATLTGGGRATHGGITMYAENMTFQSDSQLVTLSDDVRIYKEDLIFQGRKAVYDLQSGKIFADDLQTASPPFFFEGKHLETNLNREEKTTGLLDLDHVTLTTHDSETPNYRLAAEKIVFHPPPDNRVELTDVRVYAGDHAIFWLPYMSQSLDEELGWYFEPGFKSNWGPYLKSEYGVMWEDHTLVRYQLDGRARRGFAGGVELNSEKFKDNDNIGQMGFYYANDLAPDVTTTSRQRVGGNEDRYRFGLQHRVFLPGPDPSSLYLDFDINKVSDPFLYEDFFPEDYRTDPSPDNMINFVKTDPRGTLGLLGRFNLNEFFRSDERFELALDVTRQPFFGTDLFYEGETSVGAYREELSTLERDFILNGRGRFEDFYGVPSSLVDPRELRTLLDDLRSRVDGYGFKRFDTFHQLNYPISLGNGITLVPRLGFRHSEYFDIDSEDPRAESTASRTFVNAGLEGAFKFSRVYPGVQSERWGLDELRHIVQPYFNYSLLAGSRLDGYVPRIDRLTPSTQLRSLDLGRYTAVDDLAPWNILRLGVRNVFQTKRDGESYNWLRVNTYFDTYVEDPEFDRPFSNLYNEVIWNPLDWLELEFDSQIPFANDRQDFVELNTYLHFLPNENVEFSLGHRFLNGHPFYGESNLVDFQCYVRLNENWGVGMMQRFELDDNTLELQQYSIHRDLASWTASLGAIARDTRGRRDYGVTFALTLKDLPSVRLPFSIDPSPTSH